MLQSIRDRSQGWLAWAVVIVICVPFAFWGVHSYVTGGDDRVIAEVDGLEIPYARYQQQLMQARERLREQGVEMDETVRRQVADRLIEQTLLRQAAQEAGFRVTDAEVSREIRGISAFQANGEFDRPRYEAVLTAQRMTPGQFEADVRSDMIQQRWAFGLQASEFVTDRELDRLIRLSRQEREVGFTIVSADRFEDQIEIAEAELATYYEANQERYREPERVRVAYLEVGVDLIAEQIELEESELRDYYETRKSGLGGAELRRARHILIPVDNGEETARQMAQELRQAAAEEDFAALAQEHSTDRGSASAGGDLGYMSRDQLPEPFADALFDLGEGEISEPVRSEYGYHVIRLEGVREGAIPQYEAVRDDLAKELRRQTAEQRVFEQAEALADLTFEHPDTLEPAAEYLELPIEVSEPFSREGGEGIAAQPEVVAETFSEDVFEERFNSDLIELNDDRYAVLRVHEHLPERQPDLAEVRESVFADLRAERLREATREQAEQIRQRLAEGAAPETVAEELGVEWHDAGFVARHRDDVPVDVRDLAYRLPRPDAGEASLGTAPVEDTDHAVVAVSGVRDGERADLGPEVREMFREQLAQMVQSRTMDAVVADLWGRAEIKVNEDRL